MFVTIEVDLDKYRNEKTENKVILRLLNKKNDGNADSRFHRFFMLVSFTTFP